MKEKGEDKVKLSDFEKNLKRLEEIVAKLEKGEMSLEESLKLFEEGIKLARNCEKALTEAERRVEILIRNEQGEIEARPFISSDETGQESYSNSDEINFKKDTIEDFNPSESRKKSKDINTSSEEDLEEDLPF